MSFVDGTGSDTAGHTGGTRVETSTVMMSTKHTQGKEKKREKKRWRCYTCSCSCTLYSKKGTVAG